MASLAFVLPFGEPEEAYFADTLLTLLAADARRAGHEARVIRAYYHGRDAEKDREIRARLSQYLAEQAPDLVVVERLFDPEPLSGHRVLQVTRGDSVEPSAAVGHVLGMVTELLPGQRARKTPSIASLRQAFAQALAALDAGEELGSVAGIAALDAGVFRPGQPLPRAESEGPFDPVLDAHVIAPGEPPVIRHKTLFGNVGCPFADDPMENPHYRGVSLPDTLPVARLGCAFCHMGGDYEKRSDSEVVARLVEQAEYYARALPDVRAFVLSDQHALRYLAQLVRTAAARGLRGLTWLFPARPDAFLRERGRVAEAARAAAEAGHVVEVHLSGFEAFSDRELDRYNKGCTKADLLAAVAEMRALRAEHAGSFEHRNARAHSLILWNPWSSPADVRESVETIVEHDLDELFHDIGRNRLRLYRELPIHWSALRDGAVVDDWQAGDEGSARRKGYSSEIPWRFLDDRTRVAHEVAARLRDRLGRETELDQLAAALDFAEAGPGSFALLEPGLDELLATLEPLLAPVRAPELPARGAQARGVPCVLRRSSSMRDFEPALSLAQETSRPLFIVGGDPRELATRARARGVAHALLLDAEVALDAREAAGVSVRVRSTRTTLGGLARSGIALEARVRPRGGALDELQGFARWAELEGVPQLRVEISLADLGLSRLGDGARAIGELVRACKQHGVALEVAPLGAGLGDFRFVPSGKLPPTPRRA